MSTGIFFVKPKESDRPPYPGWIIEQIDCPDSRFQRVSVRHIDFPSIQYYADTYHLGMGDIRGHMAKDLKLAQKRFLTVAFVLLCNIDTATFGKSTYALMR